MAVKVLAKVWDGYPGGGSELLALLALADWSDDEGRCWPAMTSIAKKMRLSEKQARRAVHSIIETGYLSVTDNLQGGATSRRYQINLGMLSTPPADGRAPIEGRAPADVPNPSRVREATPPAHGSRTVIDTSRTVNGASRVKKSEVTLREFLDICKTNSEQAIPESDSIFAYAEKVGIDSEMVAVCWHVFKDDYLATAKTYKDWREAFRKCVRGNWKKLWFCREGEAAQWTTVGEQARRAAV